MFNWNSVRESKRHLRKVQLGAGRNNSPHYLNLDCYDADYIDVRHDIREPLPFDTDSLDEVYSHHVIEHVNYPDALKLFKEVFRCLKPGGKFVSRLPDARNAARQFAILPPGEKKDMMTLCLYGGMAYGWQPTPEHQHLFGWTNDALRRDLENCGFCVEQCDEVEPDSHLPVIDFVALKPNRGKSLNSAKMTNNLIEGRVTMWGERTVEVPWMLERVRGPRVLDIGSAESCYIDDLLHNKSVEQLVLNDVREFSTHENDDRVTCVVSDIRNYKGSGFDTILYISTLEHIGLEAYGRPREVGKDNSAYYPQRDCLWYTMQLLNPGGQLILTLPYGKFEDFGWGIVYEKNMIDEIKHFWNVVEDTYYTLKDRHNDLWVEVPNEQCPKRGMDYYNGNMRATSCAMLVLQNK
jgi:SAM-dependent methyltransferase